MPKKDTINKILDRNKAQEQAERVERALSRYQEWLIDYRCALTGAAALTNAPPKTIVDTAVRIAVESEQVRDAVYKEMERLETKE